MADPQAKLNARMHALVASVRGDIPAETSALIDEMVEANESPLAIDVLSEVLAERAAVPLIR